MGNFSPAKLASFIASPIQVDTREIYPIANYGSAMTPFYTVLALWVGALLLTALVKVKAEPKNLQGVKLHQLYFGRYLLFFVLGQIQAFRIYIAGVLADAFVRRHRQGSRGGNNGYPDCGFGRNIPDRTSAVRIS